MAAEQPLDMELDCIGTVGIYAKKYFALRKKCEQIQQSNEKLVNRLYHVKRMIKKYRRERRLLAARLEEHGDDFREVVVPALWEGTDPPLGTPGKGLTTEKVDTSAVDGSVSNAPFLPGATQEAPVAVTPSSSTPKAKKSRAEKPEKDSNAPKKPANAFLKFCQQQRQFVQEQYKKEENEDISHPELTRRLGVQWNALPQEKKNVYYEIYEQEKEKYEQELEAYAGAKESASKVAAEAAAAAAAATATTIGLLEVKKEPH